ncbi:DNA polymerase III subunit gamma/tau [Candidatus Saccharibacteria bacterium]|nr:DNA polymerase III subunit gamma/tau [Candidatus Saccharibacteria bacterium]
MLALYRKYRPRSLAEVIGQPQVTEPLSAALKSGKLSHSYLFTGPRGCGKTSVARILAHELNGFPYELEDSYLDIIEIDAASNTGVDNIRDLREKALIAPSEGKYKVYIIDEVHMLSKPAFNALLKTLEEPPAHVVFILATTDLEKVPVTITSRSQVFRFRLASAETMFSHLRSICDAEKIKISDSALRVIISRGGGSFRDTLSLLDQISTVSDGKSELSESTIANLLGLPLDSTVSDLLSAYASGNATALTSTLKSLLSEGLKPESLAEALIAKIISAPSPALLPLLEKLPSVSAPFPEAKLLVALLSDLKSENSSGLWRGSASSSEATKENSRIFSGENGQGQNVAGATRTALPADRLNDAENPTEFSLARKNLPTASPKAGTTLTSALQQQLAKCTIQESPDAIHIYPKQNVTKLILSRENNQELLRAYFAKPFVIHSPADAPVEKSPEIQAISDIMGNVTEVNTNQDGGVPF